MTIRSCVLAAARDFAAHGLPSAMLDAEVLMAHVLQADRVDLYRNPEIPLAQEAWLAFETLKQRRLRHEPVAYLLGRKEFWSLEFEINEQVLIPRPDTETLVEEVLKVCGNHPSGSLRILDLGTGSGAIAVVLALELPHAHIIATDLSPGAAGVARRNAIRHGVEKRVSLLVGHLFTPLSGKFDIVVSNPPYIPAAAFEKLPAGVRLYEPALALSAEPDGTAIHERIIAGCKEHLHEGGWLLMEIGSDQRQHVETLLTAADLFEQICFRRDYAGHDRVAAAKREKPHG